MSRLDGVRLKLDRRREHYEEIVSLIKVFAQTNPFNLVAEIDGQNGEKIWLVDGQPSAPPLRMSVLVGDCLINYRAALDHLAWQLVLVNGEETTKRTMFPISDDADRYRTSGIPRLRGISSAAVEKIESYEPCFGANEWRNRNLTGLETFVTTRIDTFMLLHRRHRVAYGTNHLQLAPTPSSTLVLSGTALCSRASQANMHTWNSVR